MENNQEFHYTYSAEAKDEVQRIRKKYLPQEEDKLAALRKLDQLPARKASAWAIALGVIGALVLGTGMSLIMSPMGSPFGIWAIVLGVILGLIGMVPMGLAYPVYHRVLTKQRRKIAPKILALTDELMK